jgi:hypothetical protein
MRNRSRAGDQNKWFQCANCRQPVSYSPQGAQHRNHCPWCLWSRHLDDTPGDRQADCHGSMEPIAVWVRNGGEWAIVHRCTCCGTLKSNRIAGDDNEFVLASLAMRPICQPAFPLERLSDNN